jgi:hypothetical protein
LTRAQTGLALAGLTAIGFALRLAGIDQGLYGDEGYTLGIVDHHSLGDVIEAVHDTSITPPLHYLLAWVAVQFGDAETAVRVPSLVLGTLTVPLVFLLGRRAAGAAAGLVAAAIVALSPFALFYSVEARAYATVMFLVTLSTLALLQALGGGRRIWWFVYAACACLALYCHYSAVFVILAQALWSFMTHREHMRALLLAHGAIVLGYAAWIPSYLHQRENDFVDAVGRLYPLSFETAWDYPARLLPGHPFVGLGSLPGTPAALVLAGCFVAALALAAVRIARLPRPSLRHPAALIALLAVATPIGILFWSLVGSSLYAPRNLSASLPALAVLAAILLTSPAPRLAVPLTAIALATFTLVSIRSLDDDYQRPAYGKVADFIEAEAGPNDPVVAPDPDSLAGLLDESRPLLAAGGGEDGPAYERAARGRPIFIVRGRLQPGLPRLAGPSGLLILRDGRQFDGFVDLAVGRYQGEATATIRRAGTREAIVFSTGDSLPVVPGAVRGSVDSAQLTGRTLAAGGWAMASEGAEPADRVLAFDGHRLVAIGGLALRPDLAEKFGKTALTAGFRFVARLNSPPPHQVRVYGEAGGRASQLPISDAARALQGPR